MAWERLLFPQGFFVERDVVEPARASTLKRLAYDLCPPNGAYNVLSTVAASVRHGSCNDQAAVDERGRRGVDAEHHDSRDRGQRPAAARGYPAARPHPWRHSTRTERGGRLQHCRTYPPNLGSLPPKRGPCGASRARRDVEQSAAEGSVTHHSRVRLLFASRQHRRRPASHPPYPCSCTDCLRATRRHDGPRPRPRATGWYPVGSSRCLLC